MKLKQIKVNKKQAITAGVLLAVFSLGFGVRSLFTDKFATIDLQKVVTSSNEVRILRMENDAQIKDLSKWLDGAKKEINSEKKKAKKEELTREYKEIAKKREDKIKKDYQEKIIELDKSINTIITKIAKSKGCRTVLNKNTVVQGGIDITEEVIKTVNKKD